MSSGQLLVICRVRSQLTWQILSTSAGDLASLSNPGKSPGGGDIAGRRRGRRILDAGCGHGYLSRMLADRGGQLTGVEPAQPLYDYATEREAGQPRGICYVQADLCRLPELGDPFGAVVANMVFLDIPDWAEAMKACVRALAVGGLPGQRRPTRRARPRRWREAGGPSAGETGT